MAMTIPTGQRYGRLVVTKRVASNKHHERCWLCKCDCGNDTIVSGTMLRSGRTKSCGCLQRAIVSKRFAKDILGERFGRLLVVERIGAKLQGIRWKCKCDCGKEMIVDGSSLRTGRTKSCGCMHREDLSKRMTKNILGQRFGRLVVIEYIGSRKNRHGSTSAMWRCKCDCGQEKIIRGPALRYGVVLSCGCYHRDVTRERMYIDGRSLKYCPAFTDALREEIRDEFGRLCFLSGLSEKDNGDRLSVHHCDYLKSQGCKGQRWSLLPLSKSFHGKTTFRRWYWFCLLRDYWVYKYLTFHGMDIFDGPSRTEWLWEMYDPWKKW
jgi:hypothetical protein